MNNLTLEFLDLVFGAYHESHLAMKVTMYPGLQTFVSRLFRGRQKTAKRRQSASRIASLAVESLEPRLVLYAATANAWPHPELITLSFQPDGTNLGGVTSNLNQSFANNPALAGRWQAEIIRAAQAWAQATNINIVVVTDSGAASGSGSYQQGDPAFGDIRIGGYNFGNSSLARAYAPPADNNFSIAGDIVFNTGMTFGVGSGFDLFTVAAHELGHALGLDHTSDSTIAEMWSSFNGIKPNLAADDIAGIQSIYSGVRAADSYDANGANNSFATADDISGQLIKSQNSGVVNGLDITTTDDTDFFKVTMPRWANSTISVIAQSAGLSLLSPKMTVYAADQTTVLGTVNGVNKHGTTLTTTLSGVGNGDVLYIKVEAAETSVFGVGDYGLMLDLGGAGSPQLTAPNTKTVNGSPLSGKGGVAEGSGNNDILFAPAPVINAISPDTGMSSADRNTKSTQITLSGVSSIVQNIEIYINGVYSGKALSLLGGWSYNVPGTLSDGNYSFVAVGKTLLGQINGTSDTVVVTIDTQAPDAPLLTQIRDSHGSSLNHISTEMPANLTGTAAAGSQITVLANGAVLGTTSTDGLGNWIYNFTAALPDGTYAFSVTATDQAGNVSLPSASQTITIDTSIITPTLTGISSNSGTNKYNNTTQARNLVINGSAEGGSTVTLFRDGSMIGTTVAKNNGSWSFDYTSVTLADGTYVFTGQAVDLAAHVSGISSPLTVIVDSTIATPIISLVTKASGLLGTTLTVQGAAEANSVVTVFVNGSVLGTVTADAQGNWSYQYSQLLMPNGTYRYSASASDQAGNQSGLSATYDLVVGSNAPTVSNITLNSSTTNTSAGLQVSTSTPAISGTATKATSVSIYDGNKLLGTATVVVATGNWTFTTPVLNKGRHSLVAVAADAAGNRSSASAALVFQV